MTAPADPALAAPALVGRSSEQDRLLDLLVAVQSGSGRLAVLRGEAGVGKTRVVAEVVAAARVRGLPVRTVEAGEVDRSRPFGAVTDVLGVSLRSSEAPLASLAERIHDQGPWSGRLDEVPVEVHHLVESLLGVLESQCTTDPLVLVFDNLHWVDSSSLVFLRRLTRLLGQYPVLVLATTRPTDDAPVAGLLGAAGGLGALLELSPLDGPGTRELAIQLLGAPPAPHLTTRLEATAGNPLLVVELLSTLIQRHVLTATADGSIELDPSATSMTLDPAVLQRLALLPPSSVEVLRTAAVLGRTVDVGELSGLMNRDAHTVAEPVRAATRAGILEEKDGLLRFRHELVRQALYCDWPAAVRTALHREISTRLAKAGAPTWRIAHHLALGAEVGDVEAASWLHRAGVELAPRDPPAGAELLQRAAGLLGGDRRRRDDVRVDLSVALAWAGRAAEAEQVGRAVVADALDADARCRAAWRLASALLVRGRLREASDLCGRALAAGSGGSRTSILLRLVVEVVGVPPGRRAGAAGRIRPLLAAAEDLGDPEVRCACLVGLMVAEANEGRLEAATVLGAAAIADAESLPPAVLLTSNAHVSLAWVLEEQDRIDEALQTVAHLSRIGGQLTGSAVAASLERWTARAHFAAGHWDESLVDLDSILALGEPQRGSWADPFALRALIAVQRGHFDKASDDLARFDAQLASGGTCSAVDHPVLGRALLLEAQGRSAEGCAVLAAGWQLADRTPAALAKAAIGPPLARLSVAAGDVRVADQVAADLEALVRANPGVPRLTAIARWTAALAGSDGDRLGEAVELLRQGPAPRPLELALACEDAAAQMMADGRPGTARHLLQEALERYDGLLAAQRAAAARARLRALGLRMGPRAASRRPSIGWEALTGAEVRVVRLVAQRLSNPEIAERLYVSRRTVESHVSHALFKLGCTSRRQLAETVRRRDATGDG